MKKIILFFSLLMFLSESIALAVVFTGAMDNRSGFPFIPGFTAHSRAWVTGGDVGAGLRMEWQVDNETKPGFWTYIYRVVRNTKKNKGFAFFDIETAADFTDANLKSSEVLSATDPTGAVIADGLPSVTISGFKNFTSHHFTFPIDVAKTSISEANSTSVLNKFDLSHYSGDPERVAPGVPGGDSSALPSAGPAPHPFSGIRVTFPGSFLTLQNKGYDASEWSFRVVTDRVPMWGHVFGWGDQTTVPPFWYADIFNNHIDDLRPPLNLTRLTLPPIDSLTGADPYQGWVLVPGPLPSVLSTNPDAGAAAVPATEPVTADFGGLMDPATINATTFTLANGSGPVIGTVSYDADANSATFTPSVPLANNTTYSATISTGATDLAGNTLASAKTWSFTTTNQDNTSPTVSATFPGNSTSSASFVPISIPVTATFNEEIDPFTLTANFTVAAGGVPVAGTVSYVPATRTAIFTPSAPLANNTAYTAALSPGVKDRAGNPLNAPVTWSFTTIPVETVLPFVAATVPKSPGPPPLVQINTPITATFNKPMVAATINNSTFKVSSAGVPVPIAGAVSYVANTATFTPSTPLEFSTSYTASITTAVSDPAGNHLPLVREWSFTTAAQDLVPPTVTVSPADGATNVSKTATLSAAFSEQIDPVTLGSASIVVTGQSFSTSPPFSVTGTVSLIPGGGLSFPSALFTPGSLLPLGSVYAAKVTGVKDLAGNVMADKIWSFTTMPDGILFPGEIVTGIGDALRVLRIAVKLIPATQDDKNHGDVAPLGPDGKPRPDGVIDISDALVLLRKTVGFVNW